MSVVICTRDRPADFERSITTILGNSFADYELLVVDQSRDERTAALVDTIRARDGRVHLIRDGGVGLSRARNLAVAATHGEVVVFTDDDCEPAPQWPRRLVQALADAPRAGIAYGAVIPAPFVEEEGFTVGFLPRQRRRLSGRLAKLADHGIGANMAVRRRALEAIGGFDEHLGLGAYFPSAEEVDIAYRLLGAGYEILHVPQSQVTHHGFRTWEVGRPLVRNTYQAIGATYAKHVRRGDAVALLLLLWEIQVAAGEALAALVRRRRPFGFGRLAALFKGAWRSFELDVDRRRALFTPRRDRPGRAPADEPVAANRAGQ